MSDDLRTLRVTATIEADVDEEDIDADDTDVEGEYTFEVDASLSDQQAASAALDEFAESVAVSQPEHYSLSVTDEHGNELDEDPEHDPYSATRPSP